MIRKTSGRQLAPPSLGYRSNSNRKNLGIIISSAIIFLSLQMHTEIGRWLRMSPIDGLSKGGAYGNYVESYIDQEVPRGERKPRTEIRYAAFGSSITWGATLDDPKIKAYVRRLSDGSNPAQNFAIRSTGPNYPAACVYSMIGDQEFDVIVLEYFMKSHEGLVAFGLRLRERFPNAIIVITGIWGLHQFVDKESDTNLLDWARDQGYGKDFIHDPKFKEAILDHGVEKWEYRPGTIEGKDHKAAAEIIGAHVVKLPFNLYAEGPGGWIARGDSYLSDDSFHLSEKGHEVLASEIKELVQRIGVPKNTELGSFRGMDYCNSWFETGKMDYGNIEHSPNFEMKKMENTEKYVLSLDTENESQDEDFGWIRIGNPTDTVMDVFITYMTTGPPPSKYPQIEVSRTNRDTQKYNLDPNSIGFDDKEVHVARLAYIGKMYAGAKEEQINFRPLETTEYPFRLVSVALTPETGNTPEELSANSDKPISF